MSGLIYTHILSVQMVTLALFVIALLLIKQTLRRETICIYIQACILCFLLSAAFVVPFLEYYFNVETLLDDPIFVLRHIQHSGAFLSDYVAFHSSLYDYLTYGMQNTPGIILMIGLFLSIYLIIVKHATNKMKFLTLGSILTLYMSCNLFPWNQIGEIPVLGKFLEQIQFPWRWISIAICLLATLFVLTIEKIIELDWMNRKKLYITSMFFIILVTFSFVGASENRQYKIFTFDTADLKNYTNSGELGLKAYEYLLDGTVVADDTLDYIPNGKNVAAIIQGEQGERMDVYVSAQKGGCLEIPRFAYPHVRAMDKDGALLRTGVGSNNKLEILFDTNYKGIITVDFIQPWYWRVSQIISLISILILFVNWGGKRYFRRFRDD